MTFKSCRTRLSSFPEEDKRFSGVNPIYIISSLSVCLKCDREGKGLSLSPRRFLNSSTSTTSGGSGSLACFVCFFIQISWRSRNTHTHKKQKGRFFLFLGCALKGNKNSIFF